MAEAVIFVEIEGGLTHRRDAAAPVSLKSLRLQDGCVAALARFSGAGYAVVLLGARSATAAADVSDMAAVPEEFVAELLRSQGIPVAAIERCAHPADGGCDCALPGIGLVEIYIDGNRLDRARTVVVGADDGARGLARAVGVRGFTIESASSWSDIAHTLLDEPRRASVTRRTRETDIEVDVDLDRAADPVIATGIGFFDHMLEQLGKHGGFALRIRCTGDLEVDEHHTVEDVALALGQALKQALGDKRGIGRYGFLLPMDEAEAQVAIDLSGRAYTVFEAEFPRAGIGGLPTELVGHFFRSLADALGAALHVSVRGENAHHMVEACFKGVARALRQALAREGRELPSTKGLL